MGFGATEPDQSGNNSADQLPKIDLKSELSNRF